MAFILTEYAYRSSGNISGGIYAAYWWSTHWTWEYDYGVRFWLGQAFTASESYDLAKTELALTTTNAFLGDLELTLYNADANGFPTGAAIVASAISESSVLEVPEWMPVEWGSPPTLIEGQKYVYVLCQDNWGSGTRWEGTHWAAGSVDISNGVADFILAGISLEDAIPDPNPLPPTPDEWGPTGLSYYLFKNYKEVAVPSKATNPAPTDTNTDVKLSLQTVTWEDGGGADTYNVYYGTTSGALTLVSSAQTGTSFTVWGTTDGSPYDYLDMRYWRIDSTNDAGTTTGDEWVFTAMSITYPNPNPEDPDPDNPYPPDHTFDPNFIRTTQRLTCVGTDADGNGNFWYEVG